MMGKFARLLCVLGLALWCSWGFVVQDARAGEATDAMKTTIDEVLRIIQDKELKQPGKSEQASKVAGEGGRRTIRLSGNVTPHSEYFGGGKSWKNLSEKEREEFVGLFQTLLVNLYADKVESYTGEGVKYINERTEKDYAEVRTKV